MEASSDEYGENFLFPMEPRLQIRMVSPLPELNTRRQLRGYDVVLQWKPEKTLQNRSSSWRIRSQGMTENGRYTVRNLTTEQSFVIHDSPMKSASAVMKLFIMGTRTQRPHLKTASFPARMKS